jgi:23S rRNA (adenine2503-C2)-methyltransferase
MSCISNKKSALDLFEQDWELWFTENGGKRFNAKQLRNWLFVRNEFDPKKFSNLSPKMRESLENDFDWSLPAIDTVLSSTDGSDKILLRMQDGNLAECVLMPSEKRVTLCVSSQIGCRMACTFCQTGKMGLTRHLTAGEILAQIVIANLRLKEKGLTSKVTNIVFMGMGEPLDNYDNVVEACKTMLDPALFGLSKHRVTVSTSGLIPEIMRLGQDLPVALAISLHSADETQRSEMMPVNRKYPLADLKKALLEYPVQTRHGITFEYVMIKGKNDSVLHAKKLVKFLHGLKAKVNLIPLNRHPGNPMEAAETDALRAFQEYLSVRSIPAPVRYSRGQDVSAACGQLASKRQSELDLPPRTVALARRREYLDSKNH